MTKQFLTIENKEVFKEAVNEHFLPLLQDTYQQRVQVKWVNDFMCMIQYLEPTGYGMAQQVLKTIYWNQLEKCACYMEGAMQQHPTKDIN